MATIKRYTDIIQSKILSKILPHKSADMYYSSVPVREWKNKEDTSKGTHVVFKDQIFALENLPNGQILEGDTYAWSLAALLDVLPFPSLHKTFAGYRCDSYNKEGTTCKLGESANNPIDACYKTILTLHKLKML